MDENSKPINYQYDAFLSYSTDPDYSLVRKTESFLESFHKLKTPIDLPLKPLNICVDGSDFSIRAIQKKEGDNAVASLINNYLSQSAELIVMCSQNAMKSEWVDQEVKWFLEHRGPDAIRLVVTEGIDPGEYSEDTFSGAILQAGLHQKPWYDFREANGALASGWSKVKNFDDERTRMAADLNGVSAGEIQPIWYRQQRKALRKKIMLSAISAFVVVIAIAVAAYWGVVAKKEEGLKHISAAYKVLYRKPSQAVIEAYHGHQLMPGEESEAALKTAFKVAVLHHYNRRENSRITGSGPAYLASRWKQGDVFTEDSPDGRFRLFITERGEDGASPPGDVYLLNNETLKVTRLEPCIKRLVRRVEDVSFDQTSETIFVTRQYNLSIYSTIGKCLGTYHFSRHTKSPIHLVEGFFADQYVLGSETKGGLWLVKMRDENSSIISNRKKSAITLQREFHGDPAMFVTFSQDRNRAALTFESGRSTVLMMDDNKPIMRELMKKDSLYAGFYPGDDDLMITAGADGIIRVWQIHGGSIKETKTIHVSESALEWVTLSNDLKTMLAVGSNQSLYIIDTETEEVLSEVNYTDEIDWALARAVTGNTESVSVYPDHQKPEIKKLSDIDFKIKKVLDIDGEKWVLEDTTKPDGFITSVKPHRIIGDKAYYYQSFTSNVLSIQKYRDFYWLKGGLSNNGPLYHFTHKGVSVYPARDILVTDILQEGDTDWLATTKGLYRLNDNTLTRISRDRLNVKKLYKINGRIYLATSRGAYVLEKDLLVRLTDSFLNIRDIRRIGGKIWVLTQTDSSMDSPGAVYIVEGYFSRRLGGNEWRVFDVFEADGKIWISAKEGFFKYDAGHLNRVSGINHIVTAIQERQGKLVLSTKSSGLISNITMEYALDSTNLKAIPLETWSHNWKQYGKDILAIREHIEFKKLVAPVALRRDGDREIELDLNGETIHRISEINGKAWLLTTKGSLYRMIDSKPLKFTEIDIPVSSVLQRDDQIWVMGDEAVIRIVNGHHQKFDLEEYKAQGVKDVAGATWVLTTVDGFKHGPVYRLKDGQFKKIPGPTGMVMDVISMNGEAWLIAENNTGNGRFYKVLE